MKILVTGASGYIGSKVCRLLSEAGHSVMGLDREAAKHGWTEQFICCDLLDVAVYRDQLAGVDAIHHLAAAKGDWGISREEYFRDNLEATRALLSVAEGHAIEDWIFYSTVSVLGPSDTALSESAKRQPKNPYGESKAECEALFEDYVKRIPAARVVFIRPSVVFGPENPWNTNIFRLIEGICANRFIMIGRGADVKTTSYIDNLIAAHAFVMESFTIAKVRQIEIYHYVDEPPQTTAQIVACIRDKLGKKPTKFFVPIALAAPVALLGDIAASLLDKDFPITSARIRKFCTATHFSGQKIRNLGYNQPVSSEDAVQETVDWYLNDYKESQKH